jgi:hypothetical protein
MAEAEANDVDDWTFPSYSFNPSSLTLPVPLSPIQPVFHSEPHNENPQFQHTEHLIDSDDIGGSQLPVPIPYEGDSRSLISFSLNLHTEAKEDTRQPHSSSPPSDTAVLIARPRFWSRKIACSVCHVNKERCDGKRPCSRCVRLHHTTHCVDRPSKRGKRQRQQLSAEVQSGSLRLSDSVPLSLTLLGGDEVLLSQSLLAAHQRALVRLNQTEVLKGETKLNLRRKLLEWVWHRQMMLPSDMEAVIHSVIFSRSAWYRHDHDVLAAALSTFSSDRDTVLLSSTSDQGRRSHPPQCDGNICSGFCPFLGALSAATPCVYSWLRSPSTPIPDKSDSPNHAFFVIKRVHDEALSRYHDMVLPEIGLQVVRQLVARTDQSRTAGRWNAGDESDGFQLSTVPLYGSDQNFVSQEQRPRSSLIHPMHTIEVIMSVQANCALERLLGYSQSELRQAFVMYGEKALYRLIQRDKWPELMDLNKQVKWERRKEFWMQVSCTTKYGVEISCILHSRNEFDSEGEPCTTYLSFLP